MKDSVSRRLIWKIKWIKKKPSIVNKYFENLLAQSSQMNLEWENGWSRVGEQLDQSGRKVGVEWERGWRRVGEQLTLRQRERNCDVKNRR